MKFPKDKVSTIVDLDSLRENPRVYEVHSSRCIVEMYTFG